MLFQLLFSEEFSLACGGPKCNYSTILLNNVESVLNMLLSVDVVEGFNDKI